MISSAEHPLTMSESNASVEAVTARLSREAFGGAKVHLLNAKNLPIPNVDGTKGELAFGSP